MADCQEREVQDVDSFVAEYAALPKAEIRRLATIARALGLKAGIEGDDLLHDTLLGVLDGTRRWPVGVPIVAFMAGVMRSKVSAEGRRQSRSGSKTSLSSFDTTGGLAIDVSDETPDVERKVSSTERWGRFEAWMFERCRGDDAAETILLGIIDQLDGSEIRDMTGLDVKAYDTKRRLVRRQIDAFVDKERAGG